MHILIGAHIKQALLLEGALWIFNICILMFPTSLEHPYQQSRGRRRGRNEPNNRDYICPCGKSYLSYPALFTHIKIKHNGRVTLTLHRHQDKSSSHVPNMPIAEAAPKQYLFIHLERSL